MDMTAGKIPNGRWLRIIPPTIIIYIIAYMDRMNISFAMAGGMNEALGLSLTVSGLSAGIFFLGYMVLQAPAGHIAEHGSAKKFILWSIIAWGILSGLTGFVQNDWQLLGMRFLLGVAEGGVYPAILIIISKWFPSKEIGRANALFLMSLPLSSVITNPISGWIISSFDWRWLFYLEGVISLSLICIWLPLISDKPQDAKWISKEEKEYLVTTLAQEKADREAAYKEKTGSSSVSYKKLLTDKYLWMMAIIYVCQATGQYGYTIWLPTLLKDLTKMSLTSVGWLTSLPFVAALGGLYLFGAMSDKSGNRRIYTALSLVGFSGFFTVATLLSGHIWLSYALLVVTGFFTKSIQSTFWSMPSLLFAPGISGGARGIINGIGNLGGIIGPTFVGWATAMTGNMKLGIYGLVGTMLLGAVITMMLPKITAGITDTKDDQKKTAVSTGSGQ
ncbi:MAG: MFS transporter [Negativicutes bacterium]|nr:MFS transporter [Negativicutes bacterium]